VTADAFLSNPRLPTMLSLRAPAPAGAKASKIQRRETSPSARRESIGATSPVRYVSTRGEAPPLGFVEAMLAGLARDGGLYVPATWPQLGPDTIAGFAGRPYAEVAVEVMRPFVGGAIADHDLARMAREAYGNFRHPAVAPLVQIGVSDFILELFHGPTLAFKDLALQLLGRLIDHSLAACGERMTLVVATSGDTGAAAIEAFRGRARTDLFVLFPHGRISDVQRRMMTTRTDDNVHVLAIEGTFDDCQAIVKGMFNHHAFCDQTRLSGVNSINWARIVAQVVYYFTSAVALGSPSRKVGFTVPTGNFGNVYAGYAALRMGLPIDRLVIATNVNDILARTIATGSCELRNVTPTSSPSMDIQVASNFERLLFEVYGRDSQAVRTLMGTFVQSGRYTLSMRALSQIRALFSADRADAEETAATIRTTLRETGQFIDPHTAVAVAVSEKEARDPAIPMVVLSTASAAKFPEAVEAACGMRPPVPEWLPDLTQRPERLSILPPEQAAVEKLILAHSRASQAGAAA
jgi:threonine synthase